MYVSINELLRNFQSCFGVLSRLCQGKGLKDVFSFRKSPGQHNTVSRATGLSKSAVVSGVTRLRAKYLRNRGSIRIFSRGSGWALGPTKLPIQWVPIFPPVRKIVRGVKFNTDLYLVRRLRMGGVIPLLPQGAFIARTGTTLTLPRKWKYL